MLFALILYGQPGVYAWMKIYVLNTLKINLIYFLLPSKYSQDLMDIKWKQGMYIVTHLHFILIIYGIQLN
jgi:hypothetical protein